MRKVSRVIQSVFQAYLTLMTIRSIMVTDPRRRCTLLEPAALAWSESHTKHTSDWYSFWGTVLAYDILAVTSGGKLRTSSGNVTNTQYW